jgi:hypothetical protein
MSEAQAVLVILPIVLFGAAIAVVVLDRFRDT